MIIGVAGKNRAGKTTAAELLANELKCPHLQFSDILNDVLDGLKMEHSRANYQLLGRVLREALGENMLGHAMNERVARLEKKGAKQVVVSGYRVISEFEYLLLDRHNKLVYIEAPLQTRYERLKHGTKHIKPGDKTKTLARFKKEDKQVPDKWIGRFKKRAHYVVDNSGNVAQLKSKVKDVAAELLL